MHRVGGITKPADTTPDTIRCCEKQRMMKYEMHAGGGFYLYTEGDLQRLKFIRYARQLSFILESIRKLLSIRVNPEHRTCQESKGIVRERLREVEARITELQTMQRSLQQLNDACCGKAHNSVYYFILETLKQGADGTTSGC